MGRTAQEIYDSLYKTEYEDKDALQALNCNDDFQLVGDCFFDDLVICDEECVEFMCRHNDKTLDLLSSFNFKMGVGGRYILEEEYRTIHVTAVQDFDRRV